MSAEGLLGAMEYLLKKLWGRLWSALVFVWHHLPVVFRWLVDHHYTSIGFLIVLFVVWTVRKPVVVFSPFQIPSNKDFPFLGETITGYLLQTLAAMRRKAGRPSNVQALRPYGRGEIDEELFYLPPQATVFQSPPKFTVEIKGFSYEGILSTVRKVLRKEKVLYGDVLLDGEKMILAARGDGIGPCETQPVAVSPKGLRDACGDLARQILADLDSDLLGVILARERKYERALQAFKTGVQRNPRASNAYLNLGTAFAALHRYDEALANYSRALSLSRRGKEKILFATGDALYESRRFAEAQSKYEAALRVNRNSLRALNAKGIVFRREGQLSDAIATFEKVIRLDPRFSSAYANWASVLLQQKKPDEALKVYRNALTALAGDPVILTGIANALSLKGDDDGAIENYKAALKVQPGLASAHVRLGQALARKDDGSDTALAHYREGVRLEPNNSYFHTVLGRALQQKGNLDEALVQYREAVRLEPKSAYSHTVLGEGLEAQGLATEAMEEYRAAVRIEPNTARISRSPSP
jgi:tetratricopeptide (TPR) repeat protein